MAAATAASAAASAAASGVVDPETFRKVHPREYLRKFVAQKIRPDGRSLHQPREPHLMHGAITTADGSCTVRVGRTMVVAGVKVEVAEPTRAAPSDGFLVVNVEIPPMCSPNARPGPPSDLAQITSQRLQNVLTTAKVVKLSDLCIAEGKCVYVLHVDIVCCQLDGSLFDAALLAAQAALADLSLFAVIYNPSRGIAVRDATSPPRRLSLTTTAVALSFAVFDDQHLLADPTDEEEMQASGHVTVVVDDRAALVHLEKAGIFPLDARALDACCRAALAHHAMCVSILRKRNEV